MKRKSFKKLIKCIIIGIAAVLFFFSDTSVSIASESATDTEKELEEYVDEQLDGIDSSVIDELMENMSEEQLKFFEGKDFKEKIKSMLNGDFSIGYDSFFQAMLYLFFDDIIALLPTFSVVAAICILCGLLNGAKSEFVSEGTSNVIFFVCYCSILLLILSSVFALMEDVTKNISGLQKQMAAALPIILTLMAASGGSSSVAIYTPAVAFLSNIIVQAVVYLVLPLITLIILFSVIGNLSGKVKLNKFNDFFKSLAKWVMGICITVFTLFLTAQGITASVYDGISFRIAKYTVGNTIPIVGGFLKDGMDLILASSILIKNAVGGFGIILIIASIMSPFISILAFSMFLKVTAAVVQPVADSRISEFFTNLSAGINYMIAAVLSVGFMYLIMLVLLICSTNTIL